MSTPLENSQTQGRGFFMDLLQQNPLALGLVALVLGALVGLLLPETSQENQLLGARRDDLVHQAQEAVEDLTHKVGAVAGVAQSAAVDALNKAQDAAKEAVVAAVDTVKDEAKNQGLPVGA